jgi:hypothetical protein
MLVALVSARECKSKRTGHTLIALSLRFAWREVRLLLLAFQMQLQIPPLLLVGRNDTLKSYCWIRIERDAMVVPWLSSQ